MLFTACRLVVGGYCWVFLGWVFFFQALKAVLRLNMELFMGLRVVNLVLVSWKLMTIHWHECMIV